jgi:acetyltransferase-like isoleucine patch superfamily enzyme
MNFIVHQPTNLYGKYKIGKGTTIGAFCDIGGTVGKNCKIQCHVSIPPLTIVEDDVFIGPGVRIANDPKMDSNLKGTTIKKGAKIGMGALIQAGITIGENAKIGMGAVVLHDVFDCEVWAGNPAKLIK